MPAEEATKIEPQAEADAKMVDLPDSGPAVDVELPKKAEKTINCSFINGVIRSYVPPIRRVGILIPVLFSLGHIKLPNELKPIIAIALLDLLLSENCISLN